jgi:hypothetical protein
MVGQDKDNEEGKYGHYLVSHDQEGRDRNFTDQRLAGYGKMHRFRHVLSDRNLKTISMKGIALYCMSGIREVQVNMPFTFMQAGKYGDYSFRISVGGINTSDISQIILHSRLMPNIVLRTFREEPFVLKDLAVSFCQAVAFINMRFEF